MTHTFRQDADYWNDKLAAYLHDPPDKALHIPGHEKRSAGLLEAMSLEGALNKEMYKSADVLASGMDRNQFPGFDKDDEKSGAIDFSVAPVITHPTSKYDNLSINCRIPDIKSVHQSMSEIVRQDINTLSTSFVGRPADMAAVRFHYVHHALRQRLMQENVGGLDGLWAKMPADTRIPDHSVWQHCGLVSALYSSMRESKSDQVSLMVFGITPVQDFIGRARKLRDFWTGSLILSWLAFEGIRYVMHRFGSDHVLYPSLIGQPMVDRSLAQECCFDILKIEQITESQVASFPNKFVCLIPEGFEEDAAIGITESIQQAFRSLGAKVLELVGRNASVDECIRHAFEYQIAEYFDFQWSACPLLDDYASTHIQDLLHKDVWERAFNLLHASSDLKYPIRAKSAFYGPSHAMAQSFMAAGKAYREERRTPAQGIKCPLHGDLEILHLAHNEGQDQNPRPENDPFWKEFKENWANKRSSTDFNPSERLSAVALVKRLAMYVIKDDKKHPLYPYFKDAESFSSTTKMALNDWFERLGAEQRFEAAAALGEHWQSRLADCFHEMDEEKESVAATQSNDMFVRLKRKNPVRDDDKYYAVLLMDGDKMGKLVNGETIAATWQSVLHPDLVSKLRAWPDGQDNFRKFWNEHLGEQRMLSPAVHAAISEALGDFALHTVPALVEKYRGNLIYAGGDDVCAVLPLSTALACAQEIAQAYTYGFVCMDKGQVKSVQGAWTPQGKLLHHLGHGDGLSISAGILITHHKRSLTGALQRAHQLLNMAKEQGGRNCLVLELDKRSGGARRFMAQWNEQPMQGLKLQDVGSMISNFSQLATLMGRKGWQDMSSSFVYSLEYFREGLNSIAESAPEMMPKYLASQLGRSHENRSKIEKTKDLELLAQSAASLVLREREKINTVDTTALIIARFMGVRMAEAKIAQGGEA